MASTVPKRFDTWFIDDVHDKEKLPLEIGSRSSVFIRSCDGRYLCDQPGLSEQPFQWTRLVTRQKMGAGYCCAFYCATKDCRRNWLSIGDKHNFALLADKSGHMKKAVLADGQPTKEMKGILWHVRKLDPKWEFLQSILYAEIEELYGPEMAYSLRCTLPHSAEAQYAFLNVPSHW